MEHLGQIEVGFANNLTVYASDPPDAGRSQTINQGGAGSAQTKYGDCRASQPALSFQDIEARFMKKIELWNQPRRVDRILLIDGTVFKQALALEKGEPRLEVLEIKDMLNFGTDLFERVPAIQQWDDAALKLPKR